MKTKLVVLGLLVITLQSCMKEKVMVIGHRGAAGYEVENSLASVQKALDLGVDAIEIDVFKIQSGETVVFHDERVERLTNGGGLIEEYNGFDLQQLKLANNEKVPFLQDVLKLVDKKTTLNIELKGAGTAVTVDHILNYYKEKKGWKNEQFIISSFRWDELEKLRELNAEIPIAVLTEDDPLKAIETAKKLNAIAINPDFKTLSATNVKAIQDEGFKVFTWTVNETADIESVKSMGVNGIFSDYPDRVKQ